MHWREYCGWPCWAYTKGGSNIAVALGPKLRADSVLDSIVKTILRYDVIEEPIKLLLAMALVWSGLRSEPCNVKGTM